MKPLRKGSKRAQAGVFDSFFSIFRFSKTLLDWNVVKNWDGAFNLTASYRRDSDVVRRWGTVDQVLYNARFSGKQVVPYEEHITKLMAKKTKQNHTAWFVSNCDHTNGANARWDYGQQLIKVWLAYLEVGL